MKLLISSDIESTAGIANREEVLADRDASWYRYFQELMTAEVNAACMGALQAGATQITVKDAHGTGRNILPLGLPPQVLLNRGWSGSPYGMVDGVQNANALALTGYHSAAGTAGNPMSHTHNGTISHLTINGQTASEFMVYGYAAGMLGVPIVFLSGDEAQCREAEALVPGIVTVATTSGQGGSATGIHPQLACQKIEEGMHRALSGSWQQCVIALPQNFVVQISYTTHSKAFLNSHYPGASLVNAHTIAFSSDNYMEVLRFLLFVL